MLTLRLSFSAPLLSSSPQTSPSWQRATQQCASLSASMAAFDSGPEQDSRAKDGMGSSKTVGDAHDSHSSLSSPSSVSNEPLASSSDEQADDHYYHHLRLCDSDLEGPSRLPMCQVVTLRHCEHYISLCSLSKEPITMISVRRTLPWIDASDVSEGVCQVIAATGPKPEVVQGF